MSTDEHSPLLPHHNGSISLSQRIFSVVKAEGEPTWLASFNYFIFGTYLNVLLIFVPLSIIAHHLNWDAALRFSFSFLAIVPLAKV